MIGTGPRCCWEGVAGAVTRWSRDCTCAIRGRLRDGWSTSGANKRTSGGRSITGVGKWARVDGNTTAISERVTHGGSCIVDSERMRGVGNFASLDERGRGGGNSTGLSKRGRGGGNSTGLGERGRGGGNSTGLSKRGRGGGNSTGRHLSFSLCHVTIYYDIVKAIMYIFLSLQYIATKCTLYKLCECEAKQYILHIIHDRYYRLHTL